MSANDAPGELARRLRDLRLARGYTQDSLAHAAGVDVDTIRKIEQGRTQRMQRRISQRLAPFLGEPELYIREGVRPNGDEGLDVSVGAVLRRARRFTDEQIAFVERAVRAMDAERMLAELAEPYDLGQMAAYDRRLARPPDWPPPEGPGDE